MPFVNDHDIVYVLEASWRNLKFDKKMKNKSIKQVWIIRTDIQVFPFKYISHSQDTLPFSNKKVFFRHLNYTILTH